jgi:hypothetical protein
MKLKLLVASAAFCAVVASFSAAGAANYFTLNTSGTDGVPNSKVETFSAPAGAALATFDIDGYGSIDGAGSALSDIFTLKLNGNDIFSGTFDMGGGGSTAIYKQPAGSSYTTMSNGTFSGGHSTFSIPLILAAGSNVLTFAYAGQDQGYGDERWNLQNLSVDSAVASATPEPAAWMLMLLGLGGIGAVLRTRPRGVFAAA